MFNFLRRQALRKKPFPLTWLDVLQGQVAWYARLTPELQRRLQGRMQIFLREKTFIGCGGLTVTDTMRVIVAAQACRLELHHEPSHFPHCETIFLYPEAFVSTVTRMLPGGVIEQMPTVRIGESWHRGSVVLAWNAVEASAWAEWTGRNVVLHEFAHQLDSGSGAVDGVPVLRNAAAYARWEGVVDRSLTRLRLHLNRGEVPIDPYAAQNPAEFFAVITELYFEAPHVLRAFDPELLHLLEDYYGVFPVHSAEAA
ncbi:zinc-dependent peptidase [Deinococcus sp. Arct2-2]|uniref:M90 family metallopeptidase n=1 Tax=Deinococcus sp. Arct2-2 TaxID=2568653 RepID=UPI0010A3C964|nr:M90 family metallopeptidase [Deinococcus sp. Arct2-2]THF70899.1 zinc-dependent peptidase [Deinococcus sp. Arct2-2]